MGGTDHHGDHQKTNTHKEDQQRKNLAHQVHQDTSLKPKSLTTLE
jgi:hypothetical protein